MTKFNSEAKFWESTKTSCPYSLDTFLGDEILRRLKETPDRVAQIFHDENREVTYKELRIASVCIAQNLIKFGIKTDDVVGVICRNSNEITFFLTACLLIGAPINPLDHSFTKDDIKHLFAQTQPKIVICDIEVVEKTQKALQELKLNSEIFVTAKKTTGGLRNIFEFMISTGTEEDFVAPKFDKKVDEKLSAILCSSGSTGLSKGVKVTHAFMLAFTGKRKSDLTTRSITFSPIYWATGFHPIIFKAFDLNDTRIITDKPFSVETLKEMVEKYELTHLVVPPTHLNAILCSDFESTCNHNSLKSITVLGSIASEALRKKFSETFPEKNLTVAYGMTELLISITLPGEYKEPYSVGSLFLANLMMKVVDDDGNRLGIGETGEICVKSDFGFSVSF